MPDSKFKTERAARAWELVAEGLTEVDFDLLEIMVLREEHPGLAREADQYLAKLQGKFDAPNVSAALSLAERRYRRTLRALRASNEGDVGNLPPAPEDNCSQQIATMLDGRPAMASWGICRLMLAGVLLTDQPAQVARMGEIYRALLADLNRGEIRNLARLGKRKAKAA